jgi:uncharacterized protein (TIGR02117 family)
MIIFKKLFLYIFILLSPFILYFIISFLLIFFPIGEECKKSESAIYLRYTPFHTDLFIDAKSIDGEYFNKFKTLTKGKKRGYLAFSWGDRGFFLKARNWDDLNITIAASALFINTPSLMHVIHWYYLPKKDMVEIKLSTRCKKKLIDSIMHSFKYKKADLIPLDDSYGKYDKFYEATQSYNIFRTCNTWSGDRLRESGLKISLWTPIALQVVYQFEGKK